MSDDAIVILKEDHKRAKRLFRSFEKAEDDAAKAKLTRSILEELTVHTYLENEVLYPRVRKLFPDLEPDILESYEEHHVADVLCLELNEMGPEDERLEPKMTVLIECVEHHMEEEESGWFPKLRKQMSRSDLAQIGRDMQQLRPSAPTNPADPKALEKARLAYEA